MCNNHHTQRSLRHLAILLLLVTFILNSLRLVSPVGAAEPQHPHIPEQITLPLGTMLQGNRVSSVPYEAVSEVTETVNPFTHMLLRWKIEVDDDHDHDHDHDLDHADEALGVRLDVRASLDNQTWSDWLTVHTDPDLISPDDAPGLFWSNVIYAGEGAHFWQVRISLTPNDAGELPVIRHIDVNTIDGRYAQDTKRLLPSEMATATSPSSNSIASVSRPAVISRTGWGCPDGQGTRVPPAYYPVKHLIVHHTDGSNSLWANESNWGDRVRSIWSFHTITRGWGDVGYNYLVAPDGTIYEGRSGGDDAVGFHDTANYGSMGVSLIGTYQSVAPTPMAQNSLVALLAWKAAQKEINPLGSAYYYGCAISSFCTAPGSVIANIAGHRHVSATSCPGDAMAALLPTIRNRVQEYITQGGVNIKPDNGDLVIEELEDSFSRSDANWYSSFCGDGGHTYYTFATNSKDESTNNATWTPNIPERGRYRVYASIPQGCSLGSTTKKAPYRIHTADGIVEKTIDQNTRDTWVDLGAYRFEAGKAGKVEVHDLTGEPFSDRRVIFFDSIKWVYEQPTADIELVNTRYEPAEIAAGDLVKVTFTVKNNGDVTLQSQAPEATRKPDGTFDTANGYVYDEQECFLGDENGSYPAYPKDNDRFRVMLGATDRTPSCRGETGGYPWRWGLNGDLAPGETRDIIGYVQFHTPGTVTLKAGIIQEYVRYFAQDAGTQTVTVGQERQAPTLATYDEQLRPLAHVYTVEAMPDNLLARTQHPTALPRGKYIGSFPWDGTRQSWGEGGPLGQSDRFLVDQTRIFFAPTDGEYTFRTISDDGSWLWVDDQLVVVNSGAPNATSADKTITQSISLTAGHHLLAFRYLEHTGGAMAQYDVRMPGQADFTPITERFADIPYTGNQFGATPTLILAAHDLGGAGITHLRHSWDGKQWDDGTVTDGRKVVRVTNETPCTPQSDGCTYRIRYQAIDRAGNESAIHEFTFQVTSETPLPPPPPDNRPTITISPEQTEPMILHYEDAFTGHTTTLTVPVGAAQETTILRYTELSNPSSSVGQRLQLAGRSFLIEALDTNGTPVASFSPLQPLSITLSYTADETQSPPRLYYLSDGNWLDVAASCRSTASSMVNGQLGDVVLCSPTVSYPAEFALLRERHQPAVASTIYLPILRS